MKLKLQIMRIDTVVLMKVLEQDDNLRGRNTLAIVSSNRIFRELSSINEPAITPGDRIMYIRGDHRDKDTKVTALNESSVARADEACKDMIRLWMNFERVQNYKIVSTVVTQNEYEALVNRDERLDSPLEITMYTFEEVL